MRICVIADNLSPPHDEGFKKIAHHLARVLAKDHEILGIGGHARGVDYPAVQIRTNKAFFNLSLRTELCRFDPDIIIYVPFASFTRNSFFRSRVLKVLCPSARVVLVGVQARSWRPIDLRIMRAVQPDLVVSPLPQAIETLIKHRISASCLPFGTTLKKYVPPEDNDERLRLREQYCLPLEDKLYLHVGQITRKRNVKMLAGLQGQGRQVLVVGSTSSAAQGYPHDSEIVEELRAAGVQVRIEYFPRVEELYKAADCYVFPVFHETGGIGFPLSVVESQACGTPVVSTRFGGLEKWLPEGDAIRYADSDSELLELALKPMARVDSSAHQRLESLSWEGVADELLRLVETAAPRN